MIKNIKNPISIIAFFLVIIAGLLILLNMKSKEISLLKAEKDLSIQREKSKVVDEKVQSAQKEVDKLDKQMKEPTKSDDEFWKEYTE